MKAMQHDLRYEGASIDQVFAMLGDREFREKVCASQHYHRWSVDIARDPVMSVRIDQHRPTAGVPSFASKFVGDEIHIVQEEDWATNASAALTVTIPGKPGHMQGSIRLVEVDGGVTETVHVDIRVGIPLVGGKIEGLIAGLLEQALVAENRVGREWLAG
ncbi:MAG TPA: DUF2505 domain-containing protein [Marmoricola sp.]|jgi:hypothetical protein|nr:DUF2505 domain-containing protein [Marmoricola sp.]